MFASIFSDTITITAGSDFKDGTATIRFTNGTDEITFFANVGELYKMGQGIENALDAMDISPCEDCHEYKADITGDEISGCQVCQDCRDEQAHDYAEYYEPYTQQDMVDHMMGRG
jgi:hypothetical protein